MQYLISKLDVPPVKNGVREWLLPIKNFFAYVEYYTGGYPDIRVTLTIIFLTGSIILQRTKCTKNLQRGFLNFAPVLEI